MNTAHKWRCYNKYSYPFYCYDNSDSKSRTMKKEGLDRFISKDENNVSENLVYWNQNYNQER